MNIKEVEFIASFANVGTCPVDGKPEFAFIGRSNVGKSSLINMLTNKKGIAKVSVTPGKTQLLNYFEINGLWYLVDLPGYGYARLSKEKKAGFGKMIKSYLTMRETLVVAFVLIDVRHELQKIDKEFLELCGNSEVPFCLVFTKADKLGKNQVTANVAAIRKGLLQSWNELPPHFITSSETKAGREEILEFIEKTIIDITHQNEHA
ncbi:MAG: YihA family ribosome biogenesis GTP-binding protein [Saprospiraceae bacterium]|nr:YihA family ribosome biogenesis GTP-binding protein [Saprospiraceae bacterium]